MKVLRQQVQATEGGLLEAGPGWDYWDCTNQGQHRQGHCASAGGQALTSASTANGTYLLLQGGMLAHSVPCVVEASLPGPCTVVHIRSHGHAVLVCSIPMWVCGYAWL